MFLYIIIPFLLSLYVGWRFKSKIRQYSSISLANGLRGVEIAEMMLRDNNIYDVRVIHTEGELTDHYDPIKKTVNLSQNVYYGHSVISAAIAAHECGHAVQHARAYAWLQFRSSVVPVVSIASRYVQFVLLGGILTLSFFHSTFLLLIGVILFALITVFSLITLPVEFDASSRALAWLKQKNIVRSNEYPVTKDALKWAASTYVAAAIASIGTLLYYVQILTGASRDE